jgi:parvulin-like peptidyl-prolyl isomerase
MLPLTRLLPSAAITLTSLALLGCGSDTPQHKTQPATNSSHGAASEGSALPASAGSSEAVVTVGMTTITKAALLHRMAIGAPFKNEVPVPPAYAACAAHLRSEQSSSAGAGESVEALERACEQKRRALQQTALSSMINDAWLANEAAADGIEVDEAAFAREYRASAAALAQQGPSLQQRLAQTGRTVSDLKAELRVGQLSNKIYEHIEKKAPPVTDALIARYYAAHKHAYVLPERRDLRIVRASSAAAVLRAKHEIESGESFADVVKRLTVAQPFSASKGLVLGLTHTLYAEPILSDAIFKAHPGVLTGPVKIPLGYYVFEVTRLIASRQLTLAQATPTIRRQLPEQLQNLTRAKFVKAYKKKWTSRTDCHAGYVVEGCRQYKPSKNTPPSDPYLL